MDLDGRQGAVWGWHDISGMSAASCNCVNCSGKVCHVRGGKKVDEPLETLHCALASEQDEYLEQTRAGRAAGHRHPDRVDL